MRLSYLLPTRKEKICACSVHKLVSFPGDTATTPVNCEQCVVLGEIFLPNPLCFSVSVMLIVLQTSSLPDSLVGTNCCCSLDDTFSCVHGHVVGSYVSLGSR